MNPRVPPRIWDASPTNTVLTGVAARFLELYDFLLRAWNSSTMQWATDCLRDLQL